MAKEKKLRIKNMKLEQNELQATTIGEYGSKKHSSFGVFVLLTLFILFVYFLPDISDYVQAYLHPEIVPSGPIVNPNPPKPSDDGEENYNDTYYELTTDLKIERKDITLSNFVLNIEEGTLTFLATNNTSGYQHLEDLNYYLELFNEEQTLLERIKITGDQNLASGAFQELVKNLRDGSASTLKSLALVKKTVEEYPAVNIKNEGDTGSLVCKNKYENVTYKFQQEKLVEVVNEVTYLNTELDYDIAYSNYQRLSNNFGNKAGVMSMFMDVDNGFKINTTVDMSKVDRFYIYSADSFKLNTEPKVVSFEMEAQGFDCE